MNILLSTDNNYVMPTGVLMTSIGMHNGNDVNYYILVDDEFTEDNRSALESVAKKFKNIIYFFAINSEMTKGFPFGTKGQPKHVSIATYYRLLITEILPKNVDKILYLDGDMIVRHNLSELWNTDINGYALGVVHDMDESEHVSKNRLPYPMQDNGYFNAGMLLINLRYWRENNCFSKFMEFISYNQDIIIFHDQDVLNTLFYNHKKWLPLTFNFQTRFIYDEKMRSDMTAFEEQIMQYKFDPSIIHFVIDDKPWNIECLCPYRGAWRYYWRKSLWKNNKLMGEENAKTIKQKIRAWAMRNDYHYPKWYFEDIRLKK